MKQILNTAIDRAIELMGGVAQTVRKLGLKGHATVYQWRKTRVPAERCPAIEQATGGLVRCEDLRPDVQWSVLRNTPAGTSIAAVASESAPVDALRSARIRRLAERRAQNQRNEHERRTQAGPPFQVNVTGVA